jgi:hypothetical protein
MGAPNEAAPSTWDTPTLPLPRPEVVRYIRAAVQGEIHEYALKGGSRDFNHERIQDAALAYLGALELRK